MTSKARTSYALTEVRTVHSRALSAIAKIEAMYFGATYEWHRANFPGDYDEPEVFDILDSLRDVVHATYGYSKEAMKDDQEG